MSQGKRSTNWLFASCIVLAGVFPAMLCTCATQDFAVNAERKAAVEKPVSEPVVFRSDDFVIYQLVDEETPHFLAERFLGDPNRACVIEDENKGTRFLPGQVIVIPHGLYDTVRNEGFVSVGISKDTSQFAVDHLRTWWIEHGRLAYPSAEEILLLADCGGSNGYRTRLWKQQLQERFCNPFGVTVRVCHYPPGASKWNPIEHRLFGPISSNWAAQPLDSHQTMLNFIRGTSTQTGLRVRARLNRRKYQRGLQISNAQMEQIRLKN